MPKKEVSVTINGKETVSDASTAASGALGGFASKIPSWAAITAGLAAAFAAISSAVGKAKEFVLSSITAFDEYSASQRKLEGTAKLSGIALSSLRDVADEGRTAFKLSTVVANDFSSEIGKLTSKSGDITKSKDAMEAFLDIGAARGLSAADTLKAVQQAVLGIDEGTDKLFGKNPSVLYQEYADKMGLAVGKMTDQEKAMALLDATMVGGEKVRGAYLDYLNSAAGQQEQLTTRTDMAKVAFGAALQPIRTLVLQGLNKLLDVLGPTVEWLGRTANTAGVTIVQSFNRMRERVGEAAEVLGRLTRNRDLEEWGRRTAESARASIAAVEETVRKAAEGTKTATDDVVTAQTTMRTATKTTADAVEKETDRLNRALDQKLGKPMAVTIGMTEGALRDLGQAAREQLPPETAEKFSAHMQTLTERAEAARLKVLGIKTEADGAKGNTKDVAENMKGVADEALKAAEEFGVIDEKAAQSLDSAKRIFSTLGDIAKSGFSFAGAVGLIGGVASIVNTMMQGDAERRRLLRENNDALVRVSRDLNGLNLNLTGEDYANVGGALTDLLGSLGSAKSLPAMMEAYGAFDQRLRDLGITPGDLKRVADAYGIQITDKQGFFIEDGLRALMNAMNRRAPGQVGQGFGDQLQFFRDSQRASGSSGLTQIQDLLTYLRDVGRVGALRDVDLSSPDAIRNALFAIRTQMNNGGLSGGALGRLSGGALNSLILEILGLLRDIEPSGAAGGEESGDGAELYTGGLTPITAGGVTLPAETIQAVIKAMDTNVVTVLREHTTLHERIAKATEGSYERLTSIDTKMDTLIATTAGTVSRLDRQLADVRLLALANAGRGPEF